MKHFLIRRCYGVVGVVWGLAALAGPGHGGEWAALGAAESVRGEFLQVPEGLEVSVWAQSPLLYNPTNMDVDGEGNVWVAEGVNYRSHATRRPEGDRIVVLTDRDGDGKAEYAHTFVQEVGLVAPLGVSVLDNKVVVSQPPHLLVYTDVNRNLVFDVGVDTREEFLSGFNGRNHDHSLHATIGGPDGRWYVNGGNCGAIFKDKDGREFRMRSPYRGGSVGDLPTHRDTEVASGDGRHWNAGFVARMSPEGRGTEIVGQGFRNSYEHCVTSWGEMFQSDNDDPPACRVSYILEYGDAGYTSKDGRRIWSVDRRPGQSTEVAHWRQEDPGTFDAGDVYGHGSPTGVAFYENGELGAGYEGMLLCAEAGHNTIFSYKPEVKGAGYGLKRSHFLTSGKVAEPETGEVGGKTYTSDGRRVKGDAEVQERVRFRPSDVMVGADGAVYVCDWYDKRVGGHGDLDESCSGTIYRIAPRGFKPRWPVAGLVGEARAVAQLRSPAAHVRYAGFQWLKGRGPEALGAVLSVLGDGNEYVAARAVWLLPFMGEEGLRRVRGLLMGGNERRRLVALRALRAAGALLPEEASAAARDESGAVRRDAALALRGAPLEVKREALLEVFRRWDGVDKNMLEAVGLAADGEGEAFFQWAMAQLQPGDALGWDMKFAGLAWRFHSPTVAGAVARRAAHGALDEKARRVALTTLGCIMSEEAVRLMGDLTGDAKLGKLAEWWLVNQSYGRWEKLGAAELVKAKGLYDPQAPLMASMIPLPEAGKELSLEGVMSLTGDAARGKGVAMRCVMCHKIGEVGVSYGPELTAWGLTQSLDVIVRSMVLPSADMAHGYTPYEIIMKDGVVIHGNLLGDDGKRLTIQSMGGLTQIAEVAKVAKHGPLGRSPMLSAGQMGLTAQEVADVAAFLKGGCR